MQRERGSVLGVVGEVLQLLLVDVDVIFGGTDRAAALSPRVQLQVRGCGDRHIFSTLS